MVKVIFLMKFRADRDPEDVRRWWLNDHGALALRNMGMKRYVQNHFAGPVGEEHALGGLGFDGCVEVWFEDRDAFERTVASPEWKALEEDGPNGFDMSLAMGGFVDEHVMRWDAAPDGRPYRTTSR
jgi:uncharacterized protein (TIGR02118 family)